MDELMKLLPEGSALALILTVAVFAGGLAFWVYEGDLAEPGVDRERLRAALGAGGDLRGLYVRLLTHGLNWLDRFLGDAGKAKFSLPSPLGNREPAPYWTAWSFDRSVTLALVYPLLSLFAVWVWTGDPGTIGGQLGLGEGAVWSIRLTGLVTSLVTVLIFRRGARSYDWRFLIWSLLYLLFLGLIRLGFDAAGLNYYFSGVAVFAGLSLFGLAMEGYLILPLLGAGFNIGALLHGQRSVDFVAAVAAGLFGCLAVIAMGIWFGHRNRLGPVWLLSWPAFLASCFLWCLAGPLAELNDTTMNFLVILGVVPLVNVPFNWVSLGLTRALLRRGCEPDAPSPLWLGLLDFLFGLVLLVMLALSLIAALQIADTLIMRGGGNPVAGVIPLLDHIAANPRDPANYWAYVTLFSTLIPSVLNALIGAVSLITWWWRPARLWALDKLAVLDQPGRGGTRRRIQAMLATQVGLGTAMVGLLLWALWEALLEVPYGLPAVLYPLRAFAAALS